MMVDKNWTLSDVYPERLWSQKGKFAILFSVGHTMSMVDIAGAKHLVQYILSRQIFIGSTQPVF